MKIFISAGHTLKNPGAIIDGIKEAELNIKIIDKLFKINSNLIIVPHDLTLRQVIDWINQRADKNDFAIEIHFNSNYDMRHRGVEAYYSNTDNYANLFSKEVAISVGFPNKGAKHDSVSAPGSLGFLRLIKCQSVLVECGYLTNIIDKNVIMSELGREKIVQGIQNSINKLFGKISKPQLLKEQQLSNLLNILAKLLEKLQSIIRQRKLGAINDITHIN